MHGRVVDERGAPIAGATIHVAPFEVRGTNDLTSSQRTAGLTGQPSWTSDTAGRFRIPIGELGLFRIEAESERHPRVFGDFVGARPGEIARVRLVLREGAPLQGRVSSGGRPIANAHVWSDEDEMDEVVTDASGAFSLGAFPTDRAHPVRVLAPGFAPFEAELRAGRHHAIELEPVGRLVIRARVEGPLRRCVPTSLPSTDHHDLGSSALRAAVVRNGRPSWPDAVAHDVRQPLILDRLPPGPVEVQITAFGTTATLQATIRPGLTTDVEHVVALREGEGVLVVRPEPPPGTSNVGPPLVSSRDHRSTWWSWPLANRGEVCAARPEGSHEIRADLDDPMDPRVTLEGSVTASVVAGRIAEARVPMAPIPAAQTLDSRPYEPDGEWDDEDDCLPPGEWVEIGDHWILNRVSPGTPVLQPGDRLLSADGVPARLIEGPGWDFAGRPGTAIKLVIRRPNGSIARVVLPRDCGQ